GPCSLGGPVWGIIGPYSRATTPNGKGATLMTSSATTTATRDIAYQLHPFTTLRRHEAEGPLVITGGHGIYVQDESGREYIEALAGLWCASLGFGEERLGCGGAPPRGAQASFHSLDR